MKRSLTMNKRVMLCFLLTYYRVSDYSLRVFTAFEKVNASHDSIATILLGPRQATVKKIILLPSREH